MKTRILLFAILVWFGSCSEDADPSFTSVVGKWKFTIKTVPITGSFEILQVSDVLTINNEFGEFKLNGGTYKIDTRKEISLGTTPASFNRFWLFNIAQDKEVVFDNAEYSNDFKTITAKQFYYREGSTISPTYNETIVITRF